MRIDRNSFSLPLSGELIVILTEEIDKADLPEGSGAILTFKDPHYSPETGGYHPVEVYVNARGTIHYITDFSYVGRAPYGELAKELDFDGSLGFFQHFGIEFPLGEGIEIFEIWQRNFCTYYRMRVYEVTVKPAR